MTSNTETQVALLGFGKSSFASKLISEFRSKGIAARRIKEASQLPARSAGGEHVTLLIDCRKGEAEALAALDYIRQRFVPVTASVVVRKPDFGQYYRLMEAGARGFFSMAEKPAFIARGLRLIAHA
jgi:hypothetical protein